MIHFLQGAPSCVTKRALSPNNQDRRICSPSICYPCHAVSDSRASSQNRHPYFAWVESRPRICCMNSRLFMPDVNDLYAFVQTAIVDTHDMPARQSENTLDPSCFENLRH